MDRLCVALGGLLLVLVSTGAAAQTTSVNGRVANVQGGVIANADVTLRLLPPPGTPVMPRMPNMPNMPGMERTTQSSADGNFSFDQVSPGQYILQVDFNGFERSSQGITVSNQPQTVAVALQPLEIPGAEPAAAAPAAGGVADTQGLLDRIKDLEQRISDLESSTVLSEPETRVKRVEVYVDPNGNEHDAPVPGAKQTVTYRRERVYRRQTINEKIEEALADAENRNVKLGVSATLATQAARRTQGPRGEADGHAYQLSSADLFFTAGLAQYTLFFADVVGLSGAPPDAEIPSITLLNSYTARLVRQNELNLREAWLRTELFSQRLSLTAGRLDLTNYFDRNAVANDETTQFISDALVNNPMLGLAVNGTGVVGVFDPKNGLNVKLGFQQSSANPTNLNDALYSLGEIGYVMTPFSLPEGNYRAWYRLNNSTGTRTTAGGISVDQKLTPIFTLAARYGNAEADLGRDHFYSAGLQIANGAVVSPLDTWGVGYSQTELAAGTKEKLAEGYYNFHLSERLRLSFHLQHVIDTTAPAKFGYLLPGVRLQASF